MPFDEEDNDQPTEQSQKISLKKVSTQKSIFDSIPKKPDPADFEKKVKKIQERSSSYKTKAAHLSIQFRKAMEDKTLASNKNIFAQEMEKELLGSMIELAVEINNDVSEQDGMGSLSWITVLLKTCFSQRDKINQLEYLLFSLEKKIDQSTLIDLISKEISKTLDKKKNSE